MAADDFFSRWSKGKQARGLPAEQAPLPATSEEQNLPASHTADEPAPPVTLEDVAQLNHDSDFSRFVARDVDEAVKRSALKKLFSNPHFNVMDRLDIYIDDYTQFTPLTPAVLASLNHAKDLLNPEGRQKDELLPHDEEFPSSAPASDNEVAGEIASSEEDAQAVLTDDDTAVSDDESASAASPASLDDVVSREDAEDRPSSQGGS